MESVLELNAGRLDALFAAGAYPSDILAVAMKAHAQLVPIEGPEVEELVSRYPFLHLLTIPANTYENQPQPYRTIGVNVLLLCRADLDADLAHRVTRQFFETIPRLAEKEPYLRLMDPDDAAATPVALHEGAARYYREQQLFR
jgi:TRAP transporter TAXI family solute receptor